MTEHFDRRPRSVEQAAQHADRRRLAAAVRAEESVDLGAAHAQIEMVDRDQLAEVLGQPGRR